MLIIIVQWMDQMFHQLSVHWVLRQANVYEKINAPTRVQEHMHFSIVHILTW